MKVHSLLTPANCVLVLIDFQPQMLFGVRSIDPGLLINNVVGLAKSAKLFKIPTILTAIASKSFSGETFPQLINVFPSIPLIERTTMNVYEDKHVVQEIKKTKKEKIVLAGLWTEVCINLPAIQAIEDGYEVYIITDACGGTSLVAHDMSILRMIQAGAVPMTWLQFLLELQRDWARKETYNEVMQIAKEHAGVYGVGIQYAQTMFSGQGH